MQDEALVILIVEDNHPMRRILRRFLYHLEYENVFEAEDGNSALDILRTQRIDIIIADLNIPKPNGLELLRWTRSNETTRNVPFLMVTGESQERIVRKVLEMGANGYILKPLTLAILKSKLDKILSRIGNPLGPKNGSNIDQRR